MFCHLCDARGPVKLQRYFPPEDPLREDQVGEPRGVIGVKVSDEGRFEILGFQFWKTLSGCGRCAPDDPGAGVD